MNDGTNKSDKEWERKIMRSIWEILVESFMWHCCFLSIKTGRKDRVGAMVRETGVSPRTWSGPGLIFPASKARSGLEEATAPSAKLFLIPSPLVTSTPLSACHESGADSLNGAGDLSVSGKR